MLHEGRQGAAADVTDVIREVRAGWRRKLLVRGLLRVLIAGALILIGAGVALEALRFTPASILTFRLVTIAALAAVAYWWIIRPFRARVSDEQVALYLEEHEPSLNNLLVSAMTAQRRGNPEEHSPALVAKLVDEAVRRCQEVESGRRIEQPLVKRYSLMTAGALALAFAIFAFGPAYLRHGLSAMYTWSPNLEAAAPYRIALTPGSGKVPRGADQLFTATLSGFTADDAVLLVRKGDAAAFERVPMVKNEQGVFEGMIFDVDARLEFLAEAEGVRSATFTLDVVDLPYAQRIDLEYRFPTHTGLEPRIVEDAGDIAVLVGTEVFVTVTPTMPTPAGQITLHESATLPLAGQEGGTLTAHFVADKDGFYRIGLQGPDGTMVTASPQYVIDVLDDMAPTVSISKPGRDTNATPVEEFFVEAKADDDFGVKNLELVYSVNGGAEKTVPLYKGARRLEEVTAGHTFYLEELGVQAGDAVSYYARAADNDAGGGKQATSDIYFLRVRPFGKDFKPATSMSGGGGGGGGGGAEVGALSEQQRQIIAGTFNVLREGKKISGDKLREATVVLSLSQGRLREQVEGLVSRMNSRLVAPDPSFKKIAELLPLAAAEMKTAETKLQARSADGAMPAEQKALQYLQQAEEEYEMQVQTQRQSGGGGGGGQAGSIAEDLADLFELEMDKMANQYETSSSASNAQAEQRIDALAEKLKELARRQQQELERQRRRAAGQGPNGGGDQQRALAREAEEAARQLERLSREQNRPDLAQAARQMQQAADAMRRAAAGNDPSAAGQASQAADRLSQVQRQLQGAQAARAERDVQDAIRQAEEIAREHADVASDAEQIPGAGADRLQKAQLNAQRREQLSSKVGQLEQQLERTANEIAKEQKDASQKLREAAGEIRDDKVKEKLRYSQRLLGRDAAQGAAAEYDAQIGADLMDLRRKLAEASSALGKGGGQQQTENALDKARELVRGVDSLGRRMQERASGDRGQQGRGQQGQQQGQGQQAQNGRQGQQGQQGQQQAQNGQQGEQGQQGQAGQQGQSGQQGQAGQQGQQGQGGQQGQQGQGGQSGQNAQGGGQSDGGGFGGDRTGGWNDDGGYGWGDARPGNFNPDDVRQFRGEARRYAQDLDGLRRSLRAEGVDSRQLDEILKRLKALDDDRVYKDVEELARLQAQVSEGLRRFEFDLRRKVEGESSDVRLTGSDEVPAEFKTLVEEYYRSLAKPRERQR